MPFSSDEADPFDDIEFDDSAIAQIDAVESKAKITSFGHSELPQQPVRGCDNVPWQPSLTASDTNASSSSLSVLPASGQPDDPREDFFASRVLCPETPDATVSRTDKQRPYSPICRRGSSLLSPTKGGTASDPLGINDENVDWDGATFGQLEEAEQGHSTRPPHEAGPASDPEPPLRRSVLGTTRPLQRTSSGSTQYVQRTLFGDRIVEPVRGPGILSMSSQASATGAGPTPGARKAPRTQKWDPSARPTTPAARLRMKVPQLDCNRSQGETTGAATEEGGDGRIVETWKALRPNDPPVHFPPDSMKLQLDIEAAKTFLYPTNMAKREYQFNIVQKALFDNVLVALPTGLGKTFIAAVVILNFFRWYPKGKIVFVAPSKPLVAQQQVACHQICGLPWDVACEMTGESSRARRSEDWESKRIFYMTPQTLQNDITTEEVDPKDIVCLVVDEAHRATGKYAYCSIVAQIQAANPCFRILALTATPGCNSQRVQEVIDNLHISLIELRTEEALDIRQYVHRKREEPVVVHMTKDINHMRDLFVALLSENCEALVKHGLLQRTEPGRIHEHQVRKAFSDRCDILDKKRYLRGLLNETAKLVEARRHLDVYSMRMFRERVQTALNLMKKQDVKKAKLAQIINLAAAIPDEAHPKMIATVDTVLEHFKREQDAGRDTRVMIFCSLRECVREICEFLNHHSFLRATPFIGQASDKTGKGLTQKQQKEVISDFKAGKFNILVSTSIGEEGLDIGEIDLILCYEAPKNSIRMLQRIGRTGRKREGHVVVLASEFESNNWQHSKDNYRGVQQLITVGNNVTLYDDVPRLIPPSIRPTVEFAELDQPEFDPELISSRKSVPKATKTQERIRKRKARLSNSRRNAPEGASMGFLRASALGRGLREGDDEDELHLSGEHRRAISRTDILSQEASLLDDSDDEALERGLFFNREGLKKSSLHAAGKTQDAKVQHTSVDEDAPLGVQKKLSHDLIMRRSMTSVAQRKVVYRKSTDTQSSSIRTDLLQDAFDISWNIDASQIERLSQAARASRARSSPSAPTLQDEGMSPSSAPQQSLRRGNVHPLIANLAAREGVELGAQGAVPLSDDSSEPPQNGVVKRAGVVAQNIQSLSQQVENQDSSSRARTAVRGKRKEAPVVISDSSPLIALPGRRRQIEEVETQDSPFIARKRRTNAAEMALPSSSPPEGDAMGPPPIGPHASEASQDIEVELTRTAAGPSRRNDAATQKGLGKPSYGSVDTESIKNSPKKCRRRIGDSPISYAFFQLEAERDTDEERRPANRSDSDDEGLDTDDADSSDLEHVGDFEATQAPRGYNQRAIYQQSLLTQNAPTPFRRTTVGGFIGGRWGRQELSDSEGRRDRTIAQRRQDSHGQSRGLFGGANQPVGGEDDNYSLGSFVCDDDEIDYASDASGFGGDGVDGNNTDK